jgi:hypothetical protein
MPIKSVTLIMLERMEREAMEKASAARDDANNE